MQKIKETFPGIALCLIISLAALFTSKYLPFGAVSISIIFGIVVGNSIKLHSIFTEGVSFCEKTVLSIAIALMGINLDFSLLQKLGFTSLVVIISALLLVITLSVLFGKKLNINPKLSLLIGIGNGVCGSSAISATKDIIGASEDDVGISVAVVNFLGTIGIFALPFISGTIFHFSEIHSGLLIGNTLQAVGQVIASGFSVGDLAGQTATVVKMTRVLMLTPLIFILIFIFMKKGEKKRDKQNSKIPLFVIGFIAFSLIPTFDLLAENHVNIISKISKYALIIAMAGIGLKVSFKGIKRYGKKALLLGSLLFLFQIIFSILAISILL